MSKYYTVEIVAEYKGSNIVEENVKANSPEEAIKFAKENLKQILRVNGNNDFAETLRGETYISLYDDETEKWYEE